ncbi:hypothetical protein CCR75_002693 [Bremia lactucae]|uniref:Uncharacterized protein n=1 Tax=Bremia lactucae TaxID=4779 RepID=A0A976IGY6_BRELC|nr:hypothetical protein CCR75_002693 [Bremia lactucae]
MAEMAPVSHRSDVHDHGGDNASHPTKAHSAAADTTNFSPPPVSADQERMDDAATDELMASAVETPASAAEMPASTIKLTAAPTCGVRART